MQLPWQRHQTCSTKWLVVLPEIRQDMLCMCHSPLAAHKPTASGLSHRCTSDGKVQSLHPLEAADHAYDLLGVHGAQALGMPLAGLAKAEYSAHGTALSTQAAQACRIPLRQAWRP